MSQRFSVGETERRFDDHRWVVVDHETGCVEEDELTEKDANDLAKKLNDQE